LKLRVLVRAGSTNDGFKLAAVTFWYEFYYDVLKNGRYMWKIEKIYEKYS